MQDYIHHEMDIHDTGEYHYWIVEPTAFTMIIEGYLQRTCYQTRP